ncbi:MAG: RsmB/NOP family class I SAM-dependent RNA methyltransferase [Pseudomonadales bacterium]|nr:RsmB/NOP family class I SAM-dependent RNA methyltransferase [Candidatus Woesebacteria bacterium]MCB9801293.1 RsmB/NOP family class I SAM-dependent RNA methyltransferase [Pseudomonadales bacterium]
MEQKITGKRAFEEYYQGICKSESEYRTFLTALKENRPPALRFDLQHETQLRQDWQEAGLSFTPLDWYPYAVSWPPEVPLGTELPGFAEHLFYPMNASSLLPVLALNPHPGEYILDACAAPGGKALFIAEQLGDSHTLIANDLSRARRDRMKKVFADYEEKVGVWGMKAELICKKAPEAFDKILLDAPCSSEAHIYTNKEELDKWTPNRIKGLKKRQVGLLNGVWHALKPGGTLVYSTCAVTPEENEWVVGKFLKKRKGEAELLPFPVQDAPGSGGIPGEYPTKFDVSFVHRVLPHKDNLDPMFVAVFKKRV